MFPVSIAVTFLFVRNLRTVVSFYYCGNYKGHSVGVC